ncbi:hypothetical protein Bealeia1_01171 [Candidatus Bealeia paramacronuclearis]|uniref:Uncharacterized protein n=1 Tax=Candidatus Bealeia paramacronuclearis TaxID=1921001 RepID=A0ABZ2C5T0_9PROT|nr:hypothetical protein [Candidatus Bealeia paramacronuclearis]
MKIISILFFTVFCAGSAQALTHTMINWPYCIGEHCPPPHAMQVVPHDKVQNMMHYRAPINHH